jgi:hypothetical protein
MKMSENFYSYNNCTLFDTIVIAACNCNTIMACCMFRSAYYDIGNVGGFNG